MKLVFFADLHLDTHFGWLGVGSAAGNRRRQALRETLLNIVQLTQEEHADALLCGGDLFERARATPDTANFLRDAFGQVAPTRVFISPGNHDWLGGGSIYERVEWTPNVHVFRSPSLTAMPLNEGLTLWGAAHMAPAGTPNLLKPFPAARQGLNLGLFHGSEQGWLAQQGEGKFPHAPFIEGDIAEAGLVHAFVGHYHFPRSAPLYTYPGNPDPLSFGETGDRGAVVVTIDDSGQLTREWRSVGVSHFHEIEIDITGCDHQQQVRDVIAARLHALDGLARITIVGTVSPDLDLRIGELGSSFPGLDGIQLRADRLEIAFDIQALSGEQTVRGQFVRSVVGANDLSEPDRREILRMGLRAFEGRDDLGGIE